MTDPLPWWATFADAASKDLALRLARADGFADDQFALPLVPLTHAVPGAGTVALIPNGVAAPLWTFYLNAARQCAQVHAQQLVDQTLGAAADQMTDVLAKPKTPDQMWRDERGIPDGDAIDQG
jgi:hypothetical protein